MNPVLKKALEMISSQDTLAQLQGTESAVAEKKQGKTNEPTALKPKLIALSADGTPLSGREVLGPVAKTFLPEVVPLKPWMNAMPSLVLQCMC